MVLLLFILLRINIIIQIMFIIFIDIDYHLLYNAVVKRNNNYFIALKTILPCNNNHNYHIF